MDLSIPEKLATGVGADHPRWLAQLPDLVTAAAERWNLTVSEPFSPGGVTAWVAPAADDRGHDLVLKVAAIYPESRDEAIGLRAMAEVAAPVVDHWITADTSFLLLGRVRPGTALSTTHSEPEQDEVLTSLLARTWAVDSSTFAGLRPLTELTAFWAREFDDDLAEHPEAFPDRGLARAGIELFRELPRQSTDDVLLCTDLHAENIVLDAVRGWVIIDPKPHHGDRHYDLTQHLLNCDRLYSEPVELVRRVAVLASCEPATLRQWAFARCVQEALEQPRLVDVAALLAP